MRTSTSLRPVSYWFAITSFLALGVLGLPQASSLATSDLSSNATNSNDTLKEPGDASTLCWPNDILARYPHFPQDCTSAIITQLRRYPPHSNIYVGYDSQRQREPGYLLAGSFTFYRTCRAKIATARMTPDLVINKDLFENLGGLAIETCAQQSKDGIALLELPLNLIYWVVEWNRGWRPRPGGDAVNGTVEGESGSGVEGQESTLTLPFNSFA